MENKEKPKSVQQLHSIFGLVGGLLNGIIVFLNTALGNIGKLLSTAVIIFTMYLIWRAFHGQLDGISLMPDISKMSGDDLAKALELRRNIYKGAIESVSGPLATLCGAVVSVIGIGITVQKFINKTDATTGQNTTTVEQDEVIIPGQNGPVQNNQIKY